jgi:hypothetical protein
MADYYTTFSCILDVKTKDNAEKVVQLYNGQLDKDEPPRFELDIADESRIWINSGESGDPDSVSDFMRVICPMLNLTGKWGFEWANTCSKLRLESFGGGALAFDLSTGEEIGRLYTGLWLNNIVINGELNNE